MRAINHALAGATIGLVVASPYVAVPTALVSHFALDVVPHHGQEDSEVGKAWFVRVLAVDALLCVALVATLTIFRPHAWPLAALCAFVATVPDFMWVNELRYARRGLARPKRRKVVHAHAAIQWFARPIGATVELVLLVALSYVVWTLIR